MRIALSNIDPNPHRDLSRNPVEPSQVRQIVESIERTGFWDNVVVREAGDRYQLAYGHNRWQALLEMDTTAAEFIIKPLSDYDMLAAMIDENATQRNQTPKIIFENVDAAIRLAEKLLGESATVEEFNQTAKTTSRATQHELKFSRVQFDQAKACLASGQGLGKDFVKHFLPGKPPGDHTLQAVIDSHYAASRKAAADKAAAKAKAEADRLVQESLEAEQEAQKATDKQVKQRAQRRATKRKTQAEKAAEAAKREQAKAERVDVVGFDRVLLERLPTQSHMQEIVQLSRSQKIPSEFHARLVDVCLEEGWTTSGGRSKQIPHSILNAGKAWWYRESGQEARDRENAQNRYRAEKARWERDKSLDEFVQETRPKIKDMIKRLDAVKPFAEQIEGENLIKVFSADLGALISVAQTIRENLPRDENVVPMDLKRLP